ncbi:MAG TPA: YigZ family protein [Bacteroidales bacterium]|nr:YigZ family protein [Bacteroidales bacterium]HRW96909.1 YigZ family protein [Bacteroidales bacterium]
MMLFDDTYKTIAQRSQGLFKDKGSRFIAHAIPVDSESQIKLELESLKKEYFDARHHCYAWILGFGKESYRINDDGEPSGTAGKPIYGQLLANDLTNALIVVIRYFGGIKLGVRGLINAYKYAAQDALRQNFIETRIIKESYQLKFAYEDMNEVMRIMKEEGLEQLNQNFHLSCTLDFAVRRNLADQTVKRFRDLRKIEIKYLRTF